MSSGANMNALLGYRVTISARVFRVKGSRYADPRTGREKVSQGGSWHEGKEGTWVEHGIVADSADPTKGNAVVRGGRRAFTWSQIRITLERLFRKLWR